jgi:predicted ester cyclase
MCHRIEVSQAITSSIADARQGGSPMSMFNSLKTIVMTTALLCFWAPASAATQMSQTVKVFYQAFSSNQPDLLDQVLAPDWEDIPLNPGQKPGRDGFKPMIGGFTKTISGLKISNDDIIEAGDKVVVRSTIEGTQAGPFAGFPSKGRPFKIMAIDIHQFKDGKVIKTWHIEDWLSGLFQMGSFEK